MASPRKKRRSCSWAVASQLVLAGYVASVCGCGSADSESQPGDTRGETFESDDFVVVVESADSEESRTASVKSQDGSDVEHSNYKRPFSFAPDAT